MRGEGENASWSDAPHAVGRLLVGRYRIQKVLGQGGMAVVYEGEHVAIGKRVAIKVVQSLFAKDDNVVHRFEHEARSASAVESEHIVHVFDAGADPDLGLFLVMELLKGEDLARLLERQGPLEPFFACGVVHQAALGLEKAHEAGVVHRDLKPANVFLVKRDDGSILVKLVDFGIAKIVRDVHDARFARKGITRAGTAIGTPQYMSPEQAQALDTVDHRTDVYSLGAALYEAIAGCPHLPERPTYEQTILQLVSTPAPRLSLVAQLPAALDDLVAEMLEHDVTRRVQNMRIVRERLEAIYPDLPRSRLSQKPARATTAAAGGRASPQRDDASRSDTAIVRPRRRRSVVAVAALAVALGMGLGVTAMWRASDGARFRKRESPAASVPMKVQPTVISSSSALAPETTASVVPLPPPTTLPPAPSPAAHHGPGAPVRSQKERPTDQVGAAGIQSQF